MYTSIAEFSNEWAQECALTQKVMDALTDASLSQQTTANGRTLGRLAWHIVVVTPHFLKNFGVVVDEVPGATEVPTSAATIAATFRQVSSMAGQKVAQQWTAETLQEVQNAFGRDLPNATILTLLIKHMIHHRGQMTVLMRQAGLMVPGVYGPAQEEWSRFGQEPPAI